MYNMTSYSESHIQCQLFALVGHAPDVGHALLNWPVHLAFKPVCLDLNT